MDTFKAYQRIQNHGDRLAKIEPHIDWEAFRPIIQPLYDNRSPWEADPI